MDIDSLYLALAEKELADWMRPEMKAEWECLRSNNCTDSFTVGEVVSFFTEAAATSTKKITRKSLNSSKRNSDAQRSYGYVAILTAAMVLCYHRQKKSVIKV